MEANSGTDQGRLSMPPFISFPIIPQVPVSGRLYDNIVDVRFPLAIACLYVTLTFLLKEWNTRRKNIAWPIRNAPLFFWLIAAHNIILAIYSAASFLGFTSVLWVVFGTAWDAGNPEGRLTRIVDVLCHVHNPQATNSNVFNAANSPDTYRVWGDGLAAYGWFFYVSKIYELADTVVLLSRGKRPGIFQVYHHTGAMICVWAGLFYMATPLWSFIFMNCGIHALMVSKNLTLTPINLIGHSFALQYTYYTLTLFKVRVPKSIKMTLTIMQITQTLIAIIYGTVSLFVSYKVGPLDGFGNHGFT
jgi:hypothetical protein